MEDTLAIFGGSFDPIHNGHAEIIMHLCNNFSQVIIVPTYLSPFKSTVTDFDIRLKMINLFLEEYNLDNKNITIDCYEALQKKEPSYAIDTINYLQTTYGSRNAVFVVGSDMIPSLSKWYKFDEIIKMISFYVIDREHYEHKNDLPYVINADFVIKDISSSLCKVAKSFHVLEKYVAKSVLNFIMDKNLYCQFDKYYEALKGISSDRLMHTFGATKASITLAKLFGEDVNKAIIATILHDCSKNNPHYQYLIDEKIDNLFDSVKHASLSAKVAKNVLKICDNDILNAIENHTTGRANMSRLEKIVYLADYIEEGRTYIDNDIRELAFRSLDQAMEKVLSTTIKKLKSTELDKRTLDAYKYFVEKNKGSIK